MGKIETKICNICGDEKLVSEFPSKGNGHFDKSCKVCKFLLKRNINYENEINWTEHIDKIIIHEILINESTINYISNLIEKDILDLLYHIKSKLKVAGNAKLKIETVCSNCTKILIIPPNEYLRYENHFCSTDCHSKFDNGKIRTTKTNTCKECNSIFLNHGIHLGRVFCSNECYIKNKQNQIEITCKICGKIFNVKASEKEKYSTCSKECSRIYFKQIQEENAKKCRIDFKCDYCGKDHTTIKSQYLKYNTHFCSKACKNKWHSENITGKDNPLFTSVLIDCDNCGTSFYQKQNKIEKQTNNYCSNKCREQYFAEVISQTDENRECHRIKAVEMLEQGLMPNTNTSIQIIVDSLLDELNIQSINEKGFKYFAIDNYLDEFNLAIECMGTFWHSDSRKYNVINYGMQKDRIYRDKSKHTYIKNNHGIEILYLWEKDINDNPEMCSELIKQYILNDGFLNNYHSFNYSILQDNLILHNDLIIPYMDWDIKDLNLIVDLSEKELKNRRDDSKWITFKCEYCGKEHEQLLSRYSKNKHHHCSNLCRTMATRDKVELVCANCGELLIRKKSSIKSQNCFCSHQCHIEYKKYNPITPCKTLLSAV